MRNWYVKSTVELVSLCLYWAKGMFSSMADNSIKGLFWKIKECVNLKVAIWWQPYETGHWASLLIQSPSGFEPTSVQDMSPPLLPSMIYVLFRDILGGLQQYWQVHVLCEGQQPTSIPLFWALLSATFHNEIRQKDFQQCLFHQF